MADVFTTAEGLIEAAATDEDKSEETREHFNMNNVDRANRVLEAVGAYWGDDGEEDLGTIIGDMLGDLHHLCRLTGVDIHRMYERGRINSDEERRGVY